MFGAQGVGHSTEGRGTSLSSSALWVPLTKLPSVFELSLASP